MELAEKARIRIEHWLKHNENYLNDYRAFAEQLEAAGMSATATHIRDMMAWTLESNQCLNAALNALG
jgi:pantothenate kinase-related protein Tda10